MRVAASVGDAHAVKATRAALAAALGNQVIYDLGDGTGINDSGDIARQTDDGTWWVYTPNETGNMTASALVDGKIQHIRMQPNSDGGHSEYGVDWVRRYDRDGKLIGERTLDRGQVVDDGLLGKLALGTVVPGSALGRGARSLWSLFRRGKEAPKEKTAPPRTPQSQQRPGQSERHRSLREKGYEYGTRPGEIALRGTGGFKKQLDSGSRVIQGLQTNPGVAKVYPGPNPTPAPGPGFQYGDIIIAGAILIAGIAKALKALFRKMKG